MHTWLEGKHAANRCPTWSAKHEPINNTRDCGRSCKLPSGSSTGVRKFITQQNKKRNQTDKSLIAPNKKRLLGYPDSNQKRQDQNLQCYHYTIPQTLKLIIRSQIIRANKHWKSRWGTRIRTRKGRTRICSVTITPYPKLGCKQESLSRIRVQNYGIFWKLPNKTNFF